MRVKIICGVLASLLLCGAVQAQPTGSRSVSLSEYRSPVSDAQLTSAASRIARNRDASRALIEALRRGDQATAADIFRANGASPPPNTLIELGSAPTGVHPEDTCAEVTHTIKEVDGKIIETWRIHFYAC
jgi:hypothetical protein